MTRPWTSPVSGPTRARSAVAGLHGTRPLQEIHSRGVLSLLLLGALLWSILEVEWQGGVLRAGIPVLDLQRNANPAIENHRGMNSFRAYLRDDPPARLLEHHRIEAVRSPDEKWIA